MAPILGVTMPDRPYCRDNNDFVAEAISKYQPDIVLL
jgi:hypothetical protein